MVKIVAYKFAPMGVVRKHTRTWSVTWDGYNHENVIRISDNALSDGKPFEIRISGDPYTLVNHDINEWVRRRKELGYYVSIKGVKGGVA